MHCHWHYFAFTLALPYKLRKSTLVFRCFNSNRLLTINQYCSKRIDPISSYPGMNSLLV